MNASQNHGRTWGQFYYQIECIRSSFSTLINIFNPLSVFLLQRLITTNTNDGTVMCEWSHVLYLLNEKFILFLLAVGDVFVLYFLVITPVVSLSGYKLSMTGLVLLYSFLIVKSHDQNQNQQCVISQCFLTSLPCLWPSSKRKNDNNFKLQTYKISLFFFLSEQTKSICWRIHLTRFKSDISPLRPVTHCGATGLQSWLFLQVKSLISWCIGLHWFVLVWTLNP